ncbi:cryptochrome/photolyase family protein [Enterovibrio coralii]|uniref:Deoxyribodipyrimidine photolyase n=1 Tax=Enterovibrio coralii TaxID=294935 RepID=A0A135I3D6_9GAMM|nr:cryptochrome/photolyase family protein [Enterovibrio coralii]KXF79952.1 deoxyribodipyrimidine photolyase [Enterovibrio coralii]
MQRYHTLRLILGDQLNASHSWYKEKDEGVLYLMAELRQETDYAKHHVQKVCAFFAAMAGFADALKRAGHHVFFLTLDETRSYQGIEDLLYQQIVEHHIGRFEYQQPDEFRLKQQLAQFTETVSIPCEAFETEHFLLRDSAIAEDFTANKHHLMESFYRRMRKRFNILMTEEGKPEGGKWNCDKENRASFKAADIANIPESLLFSNDVTDILERLKRHDVKTIGRSSPSLLWPINRQQSLELLQFFCRYLLPTFGKFQDAMTANSPHQWSLYHSRLAFALNSKMLHPLMVIQHAIDAYREPELNISLAQVEGFVRQILGWREFIRGIYWANMPEYASKNALNASRPIPDFFWTGDTQLNCMHHAITQSLDFAYAHHIQRLMITGNFALLTGIQPDDVDAWYLGIYIDAIEWVEMPNTRGMALFADGGVVATKPYAASGNYINKMSDYCDSCAYDVKDKLGENACPFNSLYWHFMETHRALIAKNPRAGVVYRGWDNKPDEERQAILDKAQWYLSRLDEL